MSIRNQRLEAIRDLLYRNRVDSQEQLQSLLAAEGITVAQATLSRDLRALGVRKGPEGYAISGLGRLARAQRKALTEVLKAHCHQVRCAGAMVVLITEPGMAGRVAHAIDGLGLTDVLGTVAGRDTVFVATSAAQHATELRRQLSKWGAS